MPKNEYPSWSGSPEDERREKPAFSKLKDTLGNVGIELENAFPTLQAKYPNLFQGISYDVLAELSLEDAEARAKFAERCLSLLSRAADTRDAKGIALALGLIGGAIHVLAPVTEREMPLQNAEEEPQPIPNTRGMTWGAIPGVDAPANSNPSYVLLLGSGTSGNRIFFDPRKGKDAFLTFPDGQRVSSPLLQHGFKILFGKRGKLIETSWSRTAYVLIREAGEAPCPCKKETEDGTPVTYKECHGRAAESATTQEE